jgi:CHAT domain-containing protein
LYISQNRYDQALKVLNRSEEVLVEAVGRTHESIGGILASKADIAWCKKEPDQAIVLLRQALEIFRARLGNEHPTTNRSLTKLAVFLHQSKRAAEALRTMDRGLQSMRKHTAKVLPILAETEQLSYMVQTFEKQLHEAASFALQSKLSEENRLRTSAWVLNGKSVTQQALVERLLLARDNQSSDSKRLLGDLEDVRRNLARLHLRGPDKSDAAAFAKEIEALRDKEKGLEGQLHGAGRASRHDPWIEIDELRNKLPAGAAYVDFLCFAPTDFSETFSIKRKKLPAIYVAWITALDDEARIVDLGSAAKIDAAVREARQELQNATDRIKQEGEPEAEKIARRKLAAVSKLVLEPLLPHLKGYKKWVLGPDGNLWLVPWACLPLDGEKYVIEKHALRFVTSGRDLVLNPLQLDFKTTAPVIFADPDFDLDPAQVARLDGGDPNRGLRAPRQFAKVARLPGTAFEAEAVTPALTKFAGVAPRRFLDRAATVSAFQKLKSPKILVVSTHGFFMPNQEVPERPRGNDIEKLKIIPGLENPLLRSGLLLAGCNREAKGQETGVLTGLEIVGTDLRGTELVVLSACQTGLGDVRNGEGVAGLRQAFQLAGAQSVVASLWNISDRETAFLMKTFFENISAGQTRVDALHEAQLSILRQRRDRHGAGHPFYWAAFTVTGR